jgi:hypothetical protein
VEGDKAPCPPRGFDRSDVIVLRRCQCLPSQDSCQQEGERRTYNPPVHLAGARYLELASPRRHLICPRGIWLLRAVSSHVTHGRYKEIRDETQSAGTILAAGSADIGMHCPHSPAGRERPDRRCGVDTRWVVEIRLSLFGTPRSFGLRGLSEGGCKKSEDAAFHELFLQF